MESSASQLRADVLIIGAGPAGLACAIHLARTAAKPRRIVVLEKSENVGGHLLSGAVIRTDALRRLLTPDEFSQLELGSLVVSDAFYALTSRRAFRLPFVPPKMRMKGLPMVRLGAMAKGLAKVASGLGVEILTSQTADSLLWEGDRVVGVLTQHEPIFATVTVLAEGPAGPLSRELFSRHPALLGSNIQTHSMGLKEVIKIPRNAKAVGSVHHTFGHPLGLGIYGGGFVYHLDATHIALGLAFALDYQDSTLHPHELFRQWKRHPFVQSKIADGKTIEYGARLIPEGGWHSMAKMSAPGAFVIGDAAGLVDVMELKGIHLAIESGMAVAAAIVREGPLDPSDIPSLAELRRTANYRAAFRAGLPIGMAAAGLGWVTHGLLPAGKIAHRNERACLRPNPHPAALCLPAPDHGPIDLSLDSALYFSNLRTRPAPEHIHFRASATCRECVEKFLAPCTRFCPAHVYISELDAPPSIRAENCLQCRCCTLKCPFDNIEWRMPQGGAGPDYRES